MRLLNTETLEFREFLRDIPPYAILSHVWSDEEVSYDDYLAGEGRERYGYRKILKLCELARKSPVDRRPLRWAWIDTCCIDKRSSAELTEAINSMFKWYRNAAICFVFLPDVEPVEAAESEREFSEEQFLNSKWFTRGWTLQELLAPLDVMFFNTAFKLLGAKFGTHHGLACPELNSLISQASGVSTEALYRITFDRFSIAQRMSWASERRTSREEDLAYCLLGLFDVNMPLLYGEGFPKAFQRLQLEIIAKSTDESIFAWDVLAVSMGGPTLKFPCFGLLAPSPQNFQYCGDVSEISNTSLLHLKPLPKRLSYSVSRRGIEVSMPMGPGSNLGGRFRGEICPLMCHRAGRDRIYLKIWISAASESDGNQADGAKLAWRSGCVGPPSGITETDNRQHTTHNGVDRANDILWKLRAEISGALKPSLLDLSIGERALYNGRELDTGQDRVSAKTACKLVWNRHMQRLGLKREMVEKLYFKTNFKHWETVEFTR